MQLTEVMKIAMASLRDAARTPTPRANAFYGSGYRMLKMIPLMERSQ
ncbi:hypothetical protein [Nostoc sp. FACHB-280]|nr:hypothetical protein [Nostoc sp. FACHB-280]MBD2496775.1 hypothetical protein [Nostoc sp. FACHB-280]